MRRLGTPWRTSPGRDIDVDMSVFKVVGYLVHVADGEGREGNLPDWLGVTVKAHQHRGGVSFVEHLAKV